MSLWKFLFTVLSLRKRYFQKWHFDWDNFLLPSLCVFFFVWLCGCQASKIVDRFFRSDEWDPGCLASNPGWLYPLLFHWHKKKTVSAAQTEFSCIIWWRDIFKTLMSSANIVCVQTIWKETQDWKRSKQSRFITHVLASEDFRGKTLTPF